MYCLLRSICTKNTQFCVASLAQKRFVKVQPIQPLIIENETFEQKNARLNRPLSPHLTIYKPQITSILSITHRVTGATLSIYLLTLGGVAYFDLSDDLVLLIKSLDVSPFLWYGAKTVLALPVAYHMSNGIRHLLWDTGAALHNKGVNYTGYGVLVTTLIISLLFASMKIKEE